MAWLAGLEDGYSLMEVSDVVEGKEEPDVFLGVDEKSEMGIAIG